ncbi:MAG: NYN domain-containing protein [Gammaproteobacteria bacterium]|nr:NYN domain-containing protein [Gammaproteobacteria bacterium]
MKTLIFVDGQNLFYSLKRMELKVGQVHWGNFFDSCLEAKDQLIRAYWYQAEKINRPRIDEERTRRVVQKEHPHLSKEEMDSCVKSREMDALKWWDQTSKKYRKQLDFYDHLSRNFPQIEMVRRGLIKVDPFNERFLTEKGVDVALAVGMMRHQKNCDKIILISGDMDYGEAVRLVKDEMKIVHIVRLFIGEPPRNKNLSKDFATLADRVIDMYESEIKKEYVHR